MMLPRELIHDSDPVKCRMAPTPCNVCSKNIRECPLAVWLPEPKGKQNGG